MSGWRDYGTQAAKVEARSDKVAFTTNQWTFTMTTDAARRLASLLIQTADDIDRALAKLTPEEQQALGLPDRRD